jgi:co-chaperonin GroES (HSP10)
MTKFIPLRKQVLIAQVARKTTTDSGIIIEHARSVLDNETARVLAVGSEVTEVAVGDEVLVAWEKGRVITIDGEQRICILEEHIVAVLEKD